MSTEIQCPEWLVPGAKVICHTTGGAGTFPNVTVTTINRVAGKSFTVTGEPGRFFIRDLARRTEPGTVWSRTRHVVPFDSDEGRAILVGRARRARVNKAHKACKEWLVQPTIQTRDAAIMTLQAVQDGDL